MVVRIEIDYKKCVNCNECVKACSYGVLEWFENMPYVVDPTRCAGCRACEKCCPTNAITVYEP